MKKNKDIIDEIRRKGAMSKESEDAILEIFKDRVDEKVSATVEVAFLFYSPNTNFVPLAPSPS